MQLSDFGVSLSKAQLHNGMPLVVFERPGMPISLRVAFFNGSRFDPPGKEGLAHFAEHLFVSGTEKFPTKRDIGLFVESVGATFNASTSADKMDVYIDFAVQEDTPEMVALLDQFIQHSLFDLDTIERERGAIMAELAGKKSDPGVYIYRLWKLAAYQQSPLARDTIGSDESLLNIGRDDLLGYYSDQLEKRQGIIIASGGITADTLAKQFNGSDFVAQRRFAEGSVNQVQRSRHIPTMVKHYPDAEQAHVAFGFPTIPEDHPDFWPLFVLSRILGSGRTARLSNKLRNELGLVYSVRAGIDSWYGSGSIVTYTSCKTTNVQQVLDVITEEFETIIAQGVPERELAHKKEYLTKLQLLRMQTSSAWVGYHADSLLKYPDQYVSIAHDLTQINSVTAEQVHEAAKKYFKPDSWYVAICGDIDADQIRVKF